MQKAPKETVIQILQNLTNKKIIVLTQSGDHSISCVLKSLKNKINTILIQDQGGWLTYKDYSKKEGFNVVELKTDYGIIDLKDLQAKANETCALLVNSLTGYCAEQPIKEIFEICKQKNSLLINDISGSIGTENAKIADIIIGSFGKDKPVNLHYGGFIATNKKENFDCEFNEQKIKDLQKELENLPKRRQMLTDTHNKIKKDLLAHEIIHKNNCGINVIVKFNNQKEKQDIINYCTKNNYEWTLCPRYIRVNENAISIEVKRLR